MTISIYFPQTNKTKNIRYEYKGNNTFIFTVPQCSIEANQQRVPASIIVKRNAEVVQQFDFFYEKRKPDSSP